MVRKHPSIEGLEANISGEIFYNGKLRKGTITASGYRQYKINYKTYLGHRLVAECFLGRVIETEEEVNHKDSNRSFNSVYNLEIGTSGDNNVHRWRVGYREIKPSDMRVSRPDLSGSNNPMSKLSEEDVENLIKDFFSGITNTEAGEKYGIHPRYVSLIRHKRRWKSVWIKMGLEGSTTIPSGSRAESLGLPETETSLQLR